MGALAFKLPHYSQGSGLESVCCLKYPNTRIGFVCWLPGGGEEHRAVSSPAGQSYGESQHQDNCKEGLLKASTGKQFNNLGFEKRKL